MKTIAILCLCVAGASFLRPAVAAAQSNAVLVVDVGEDGSGAFVRGAEVALPDAGIVLRTDWQGEVVIRNLPRTPQRVTVRRLGYASSELTIPITTDTSLVFFSLQRAAAGMDTVRITASAVTDHLRAFDTRRRLGIGRFVSESLLVAHEREALPLFFVSRFPGVHVVPDPDSPNRYSVNCALFLDDLAFYGTLDDLQPAELAGVEFYATRAELPPQYQVRVKSANVSPATFGKGATERQCTILMWSKW